MLAKKMQTDTSQTIERMTVPRSAMGSFASVNIEDQDFFSNIYTNTAEKWTKLLYLQVAESAKQKHTSKTDRMVSVLQDSTEELQVPLR